MLHSGQFDDALTYLFCDPEWLFSKCFTMTLTSVMEDLRLGVKLCEKSINQKKQQLALCEKINKKKDPKDITSLEEEMKVLEGIRLVTRMVLLAADSIRKDAVNLPLVVSCIYLIQIY